MTLDTQIFNAIVEAAKAKAADSPAWLRAIDRAVEGILSGELLVTTLSNGALVTSSNGSYLANGACSCKSFQFGHKECKHRAAARLIERYEAQVLATKAATGISDVATSAAISISPRTLRAQLITDINAIWTRRFPGESIGDSLMRRFRVNTLDYLAEDMLAGVLAAIAM